MHASKCVAGMQNGDADVPVYVVVLDHTASPKGRHTVAIKELPGNSTANQLHELLQLQRAAAHGSCAATHLLVRRRLSPPCYLWLPLSEAYCSLPWLLSPISL